MSMALNACGLQTTEDEVNRVMGARPMKGAAWEDALACAQHYGCRATLTMPSTIDQLRAWTDQGAACLIAWNPEGRDWSHASTVYDVTDGLPDPVPEDCQVQGSGPGTYVWVADPNIPHPHKTTRIVHEDLFYSKWYEKWPNYLVRRPACVIECEITPAGRQVVASARVPMAARLATRFLERQARQRTFELHVDYPWAWTKSRKYPGGKLKSRHPKGIYLITFDEKWGFVPNKEQADLWRKIDHTQNPPRHDERAWLQYRIDLAEYARLKGHEKEAERIEESLKKVKRGWGESWVLSNVKRWIRGKDLQDELVRLRAEAARKSTLTAADLETFQRAFQDQTYYHQGIPEKDYGKEMVEKWLWAKWIAWDSKRMTNRNDPYRERTQDYGPAYLWVLTEAGKEALRMTPADLADWEHPRGNPKPVVDPEIESKLREPEPAPRRTRAPSKPKTVVDSAVAEKIDILNQLAAKVSGWPEGLAHVQAMIDTYEAGNNPSPDDLKKLRNYLYRNRMRGEADHFRQATGQTTVAGGRSPNQVGSSAMLKRQGYTPVDFMFGEALPHRRPVVMQGEEVQDRRGKLWLFVGVGEDGKPILAEDERGLERMKDQLIKDRLHHRVSKGRRRRKKKPQSEKDKLRVPTEAPKRRNRVVQKMVEQSWGSGKHHNRERDVQRGRSRKEKHKENLRDRYSFDSPAPNSEAVADRYLRGSNG
jgi:hypothetical protein